MERRNVTISVSTELLKKAKHIAIERGTSLSGLLTSYLEEVVDADKEDRESDVQFDKLLKEGFSMGTGGKASWTREELHER